MKNHYFKPRISVFLMLLILIMPFQLRAEISPGETRYFKNEIYQAALKIGDISQDIHSKQQQELKPEVKGASAQVTASLSIEEINYLTEQILYIVSALEAISKAYYNN